MAGKSVNEGVILVLFCATIALMTLARGVHAQSGFNQAHTLLAELDHLQKSGQHDSVTIQRLNELVSRAQKDAPALINEGILELLNSLGSHSAEEIRLHITRCLQLVPTDEYTPEVFVLRLAPRQEYFIAYSVPYCASCSRAWIGVIGGKNGHYEIISEGGDSFDGKSLHVVRLDKRGSTLERFLVYGTNWGDAHSRLSVIAYVVDQGKLRRFWARTDLPQGQVTVTPKQISLTFLTSLAPPWSEKTDIYEIKEGEEIKLEKSFLNPNP